MKSLATTISSILITVSALSGIVMISGCEDSIWRTATFSDSVPLLLAMRALKNNGYPVTITVTGIPTGAGGFTTLTGDILDGFTLNIGNSGTFYFRVNLDGGIDFNISYIMSPSGYDCQIDYDNTSIGTEQATFTISCSAI
ncbi:MAG: hypothetical protein JXA07_01715 [Spirochaetes bacterium]|nr:hypothetical protein [Spirochaetota bacterium]